MILIVYNELMASQGNTSIKARKFTFALHNPDQWQQAIDFVEDCPAYAYIKHDKDPDSEPHYHFYIEFPNPRSLNSVALDFNLPSNMIEKVRCPQGLLAYLTHTDQKSVEAGKHAYSFEEIKTNLPESAFSGPLDKRKLWIELSELVDDYFSGRITYRFMCQRYMSFVDSMTPVNMLNTLFKLRSYAVPTSDDFERVPVESTPFSETRNMGLSKCSEFHVPDDNNTEFQAPLSQVFVPYPK